MRARSVFASLLSLFLLALAAVPVQAQTALSGAIAGTVTDPQGGAVPGASVQATNLRTNQTRSAHTDRSGGFVLPLLEVGSYRLEIAAAGFAPLSRSPIEVRVTETSTVHEQLELGATRDVVTVTAAAEQVQRTSATLGGLVEPATIVQLPLASRNYTQLMVLSPGIATSVPNAGAMGSTALSWPPRAPGRATTRSR